MNQLAKTTFTNKDAWTATVTLAGYTSALGYPTMVKPRVELTSLVNAGATYTLSAQLVDEDGQTITVWSAQFVDTGVVGRRAIAAMEPISLADRETLNVRLLSTAAGDTAVGGTVWFYDAGATNLSQWLGATAPASPVNFPLLAIDANGKVTYANTAPDNTNIGVAAVAAAAVKVVTDKLATMIEVIP